MAIYMFVSEDSSFPHSIGSIKAKIPEKRKKGSDKRNQTTQAAKNIMILDIFQWKKFLYKKKISVKIFLTNRKKCKREFFIIL